MINSLKPVSKVTIYDYPALTANIWFPTLIQGSKFQNVKVRQAVSYAIDFPTIIKSVYGAEYQPMSQLSYTGSPYFNKDITGYKYDVAKAKALLAEAGFPNGFDTTNGS